jgi:hypothetical protein
MENFMKIDENFVSDFLKKVMRGAISSKEKQFLKDNPKVAQKVKDLRKANADLVKLMKNISADDL